MDDELIKKQDAIDAVMDEFKKVPTTAIRAKTRLEGLPPVQSESTRIFVELVARYPDPPACMYMEYVGKPYYSIKYIENGETHVGYSTYSLEVLSRYLKEYFMLPIGPEIIRCKECEFWAKQQDSLQGRCALMGTYPTGNWFCGNAKRREHNEQFEVY